MQLAPGENRMRVEVSSGASLGVAETYVDADGPPAGDAAARAISTCSRSASTSFRGCTDANLAYAARDAEELARVLRASRAPRHFRSVHVRTLSDLDDDAARPRARSSRRSTSLAERRASATRSIVFLASHGVSDARGDYFFVPRDARAADIAAVRARRRRGAVAHPLERALRRAAPRCGTAGS